MAALLRSVEDVLFYDVSLLVMQEEKGECRVWCGFSPPIAERSGVLTAVRGSGNWRTTAREALSSATREQFGKDLDLAAIVSAADSRQKVDGKSVLVHRFFAWEDESPLGREVDEDNPRRLCDLRPRTMDDIRSLLRRGLNVSPEISEVLGDLQWSLQRFPLEFRNRLAPQPPPPP